MASYNKVVLMGNLTRDPELRITQQGTSICKFSIAVGRQTKAADGTTKEETAFIDVDAFGKQADLIAKYLTKGRPILLDGRLRMDQWETQSGEKRSRLGVVLENFQFIGSRGDEEGAQSTQALGGSSKKTENVGSAAELVEDLSKSKISAKRPPSTDFSADEDVPF